MKALKYLFSFYINSSIHVALAVTALAVITALHFKLPIDKPLLFYIFFGAVTGYNFIKYAGIAKLHHRSLAKNLRILQIFSFLCFFVLVYFALRIELETLLFSGIFGLLTLLYALPVFSGSRNLRTVRGIKVHIISLVWAGVSVVCPIVEASIPLGYDVLLEFVQRYLLVLVLLLPFEIRDLQHDQSQLGTIPQRIGVKKTRLLGLLMLIPFLGVEIIQESSTTASFMAVLATAILTAFLILRSKEDQSDFYASFWVEGVPIVWLVVLVVLKKLL